MKWISILLLILSVGKVWAFDYPYTLRSPDALLMGDAFTAVNDDSYTLFYNPASLGRHKSDFTLNPFNPQINGSNVISDMDRFSDAGDSLEALSDSLMNYPAHVSAGIAPGFKLFNVGVTFLASESMDVLIRNKSHPMLDLDMHSDKGVMMGIGIPIGTNRISRKSQMGSQTTFGLGMKYIERTGIRDTIALAGPTTVDTMGQDDLDQMMKSLGRVKGIGYGFDAGFEHIVRKGNSQLVLGLAALDITGTDFTENKTPDNLQVSDIRDQINLGMAFGQNLPGFHYILSADVRALNEEMEFSKRLRIGAQIGLPAIKLMAGMNSGYYSYGASLDMGVMKLTAGFYDLELGSRAQQIKSRRFIIYLSLFDFSFDA